MQSQDSLKVVRYPTLTKLQQQHWDKPGFSQPLLDYDLLSIIEDSGINNLQHFYFQLLGHNDTPIGRANAYLCLTDFATMESGMSMPLLQTLRAIKKIYPRFLAFNMLECGFFITLGEGLEVTDSNAKKQALAAVADDMEKICTEQQVDFLFFRDVPLEAYETYKNVLLPRGYLPTLGFPNAILEVKWNDLQDFYKSFRSKERLKLKNSLLYQEKFNIECRIIDDYQHLTKDFARLWKNVSESSTDYSREVLDENFFNSCSRILKGKSEAITFWYKGEIVAFMLNLFNRDEYFVMDWGVNYDFEHYRQANLYRAASVLSVEQAIKHKKKRVAFGITNYVPKQLVGATVQPLIYFIKHTKNNVLTYTLARSLMSQIVQPDCSDFFEKHPHLKMYADLEQAISQDQSSSPAKNPIERVVKYAISSVM